MPPRLTVVLPLKGRHLFTLRFLWHANRMRAPYRILIADGEVHPIIARVLENSREVFPELDIEYVRYPDDVNFSRFFAKMADALTRVRTPYAMLADNDDFLGFAGIERSLDFLESHADHVASAGRIAGFSVYSGLNNPNGGLVGRLNRLCMYFDAEDIDSSSVAERLRQGALRLWVYYAVCRTEALAAICRETSEIDFTDLLLHESFHIMRALSLGKIHADHTTVSYFRQYGTSSIAASSRDWVPSLLRGRFSENVKALTKCLAAATAAADSCKDVPEIDEFIIATLEGRFRQFVQANYGSTQEIKKLARKQAPKAVAWLQNRPRFLIGRERTAFGLQLKRAGASQQDLESFRAELAIIEDALSGEAFYDFVEPYLVDLRSGAAANIHSRLVRQPT